MLLALPAAAQPPLASLTAPVFGPKTLLPAALACVDRAVDTRPAATLHVVAPHVDHYREFSVRDDVVVLSGGTPQGLAVGQRFFTRRFQPAGGRGLSSPVDFDVVRTTGWMTVVAADEHSALARVDYACTGVAAGDYLETYAEPVLPAEVAAAGPTEFSNLGRVLFGVDRRESFGAGDILSIDRGTAQGLTNGTRVAFYRDRQNGTPLVELGTGVVIETGVNSSKVVLDRARFHVLLGDYFGIRRP